MSLNEAYYTYCEGHCDFDFEFDCELRPVFVITCPITLQALLIFYHPFFLHTIFYIS